MDLALNNLQCLICTKTKQKNQWPIQYFIFTGGYFSTII